MSAPAPAGFEVFTGRGYRGSVIGDDEVSVSRAGQLTITESQWQAMGAPEYVEQLIDRQATPILVAVRAVTPESPEGAKVTRISHNRHQVYLSQLLKAAGWDANSRPERYAVKVAAAALVFCPSTPKS